jgi:small subunit ribosomal protein S4
MAKNSTARGKIVRRFGLNIFGNPKYDRLLKKKPAPPGEPKKGRPRQSEYGRQLAEKQKIKFAYALSERQFRNVFEKAKRMKGVAGHNMLILLERRLDNVIYRLTMAASRAQARQLVGHGHIYVNGRRLNVPSALVRAGDEITIKDRDGSKELLRKTIAENNGRPIPPWLTLEADQLKASVKVLPTRDMIPTIAEEQLIVEFYSK